MKKLCMFEEQSRVYNLDCRTVDLAGTNANLTGCVLAPGEQSEAHNHFEDEIFIFAAGHGRVETGSTFVNVEPGDAVVFERFENHIILNTSDIEPLRFHSIYWARAEARQQAPATRDALIFSTPPTPNGDLHLGHLSGPYLAADVLRRQFENQGRVVRHLTGRDDHQTYVETCAAREGITATACASRYADAIRSAWTAFGIELNGFIVPDRSGPYAAFVHNGIGRLYELGFIVECTEPALFDDAGVQQHEAHIHGDCPYCNESSDGNACEACGRPNSCTDLQNVSAKTGREITLKDHTRLVFRLSAFAKQLAQYVRSATMPAHVLSLCMTMIEDGLPDISISHRSSWGIAHDIKGFEDQSIYVWLEMAFGYLWGAAASKEMDFETQIEAARRVYNHQADVVHCYGFDNAYYHTLLFPAVYMALGVAPPSTHIVNELLDLEGAKFSTSRRHLIWGRDLARNVPRDYARYMLLSRRPEGLRENFVLEDVVREVDNLFAGLLNAVVARFVMSASLWLNASCEPGAWLPEHRRFAVFLDRQREELIDAASPDGISPRTMTRVLRMLIEECDRFQRIQDWLLATPNAGLANYARTVQALVGNALTLIAQAAGVIMPDLSNHLVRCLSLTKAEATIGAPMVFIEAGRPIVHDAFTPLTELPRDLAERIRPNFLQTPADTALMTP